MGLEINAARSAIYGRLAGDSQLGTYVGSRIYMGAAPEGTQASGLYVLLRDDPVTLGAECVSAVDVHGQWCSHQPGGPSGRYCQSW